MKLTNTLIHLNGHLHHWDSMIIDEAAGIPDEERKYDPFEPLPPAPPNRAARRAEAKRQRKINK